MRVKTTAEVVAGGLLASGKWQHGILPGSVLPQIDASAREDTEMTVSFSHGVWMVYGRTARRSSRGLSPLQFD